MWALMNMVTKAIGEVAPVTDSPAAPETTDARNTAGHSEQEIPASSIGSDEKKRTRDEASPSTSQNTPVMDMKTTLTNEPAPKRPRTETHESNYQGRIDALTACLLKSYKEIRRHERGLPLAKNAESTIRSNIQTVLLKMSSRTPELFDTRMKDFLPLFQNLSNHLKRRTAEESPETMYARHLVEDWARDFMDGPLLFNAWPNLSGAYRQVLIDLRLPLEQIENLSTDLRSYHYEELGLYCENRTDAISRCAQILRLLQPSKNSTTRSYDDVETRYRHDQRLGDEVASMTAAHGYEQKLNVISGDNMSAMVQTLAGAVVGGNVIMADALKKALDGTSVQNILRQITTPSTTAPVTTTTSTTVPSTTATNNTTPSTAPSAESVSSTEEQARAVLGIQQGKMGLVTAAETQEKAAWYKKIEERMWQYDQAIAQFGFHQTGGPIPTSVVNLQIPDVQACYIRLVQLWKNLGIDETWDLQKLRTCKDSLYSFAIAMREAHYILQLLVFYGDSRANLGETGWSLSHMRWVQSDMVPYSSDLPLVHSKSDVDMICQILERYCPEQPLLKRQFKPVDEAAEQAKTDADTMVTDGDCPYFAQGICRNINTCTLSHPEYLRKTAVCLDFNVRGICRWGLGCSYTHAILQTQAIQIKAAQGSAPQIVNGVVPVQPNVVQAVAPQVVNGYCKNWARGKCNNNNCPRLHQHPPQGQVQQPAQTIVQNGGQVVKPVSQPAATNQQVCRQFAQGGVCKFGDRCRYSHATTQQAGDVQMGGAANNGDNRNGTRNSKFNRPCNNEKNGQACTNNNCVFLHSNFNSRTYATTNQAAIGQVVQNQPNNNNSNNNNSNRNNNGASNIKCHGCGHMGHKKPNCQQRGNQQQQSQGAGGAGITCFNCGQVGHTKRNCPVGQGWQNGGRRGGGRR